MQCRYSLANSYHQILKHSRPGGYLNWYDLLENLYFFTARHVCKQLRHNVTALPYISGVLPRMGCGPMSKKFQLLKGAVRPEVT
jgi:hypothetical protein